MVLTTYPVAEIEWRGEVNKTKVKCKYCSKLFSEKKLRDHNKYWCGPNAKRTTKQRKTDKKSEATVSPHPILKPSSKSSLILTQPS